MTPLGPGSITAEGLFARIDAAFTTARTAVGGDDVRARIGGFGVHCAFAGTGFDGLVRALALEEPVDGDAYELTVRLFDTATTGVGLPPGSWPGTTPGPLGRIDELSSADHEVAFDVHSSFVTVLDRRRRTVVGFVPDARDLPAWERARPLRLVFAAWADSVGMHLCHAAAVGEAGRGLLLAAPGGSGKSTTALACLRAGMEVVGDDFVVVEPGPPTRAHALYRSASLHPDHAARHQDLIGHVDDVGGVGAEAKAVTFTGSDPGPTIGGSATVVALVVPRVGSDPTTTWAPTSAARVLQALAPSSLVLLDRRTPAAFAALAMLSRSLPAYELVLGHDVTAIAPALRGLLAEVGAA